MIPFAKKENCPASETLEAYRADTLSIIARRGVAAHLRACEFCGAEVRLLARAANVEVETSTNDAPPVPFALRLFAESRLAEANALAPFNIRRAA
jgi:hypothetical protein